MRLYALRCNALLLLVFLLLPHFLVLLGIPLSTDFFIHVFPDRVCPGSETTNDEAKDGSKCHGQWVALPRTVPVKCYGNGADTCTNKRPNNGVDERTLYGILGPKKKKKRRWLRPRAGGRSRKGVLTRTGRRDESCGIGQRSLGRTLTGYPKSTLVSTL